MMKPALKTLLSAMPDGDVVRAEVEAYQHSKKLAALLDDAGMPWDASPFIVTDDHPLVEYPDVASELLLKYQRELSVSDE